MSSVLRVNEIQNTGGTRTLLDNTPCVDLWRLSSDFTTNAATITGWERPDDGYNAFINGLTESSGIFTFAVTGLYEVQVIIHAQNTTSGDGSFGASLEVSSDGGSNWDNGGYTFNGDVDTGTNKSMTNKVFVNVTDTSLYRFRLVTNSLASGTKINGNTDYNYTLVSFVKLAPTQ